MKAASCARPPPIERHRDRVERAESTLKSDVERRRGDGENGRERKELRSRSPSTPPETLRRAATAATAVGRCDGKNQDGDDHRRDEDRVRRDQRTTEDRLGKTRGQRPPTYREATPQPPPPPPPNYRESAPNPAAFGSVKPRFDGSHRPAPSPETSLGSRSSAFVCTRSPAPSSTSPRRSIALGRTIRPPSRASTPPSRASTPPSRATRDQRNATEAFSAISEADDVRSSPSTPRAAAAAAVSSVVVAKSPPQNHLRSTGAAAPKPRSDSVAHADSSESKNRSDRSATSLATPPPSTPKRAPVGFVRSPSPPNRSTAHTPSTPNRSTAHTTSPPRIAAPGTLKPAPTAAAAATKGRSAFAIDMNGTTLHEVQASGLPVYRMVRATVEGTPVWVLAPQTADFPFRPLAVKAAIDGGSRGGTPPRALSSSSSSSQHSPAPTSPQTPASPLLASQSTPTTSASNRAPAAPAPISAPAASAATVNTPTPEAFRFSAPMSAVAVASVVAAAAPAAPRTESDGDARPPGENAGDSERLQQLVEDVDAVRTEQLCKRIVHDRVPPLYGGYYDRKDTRDLPLFEPTHVMAGTYVNAKGSTWWKAAYSVTRGAYWGEVPDFDNRVPHEYEVRQYVTDRVGWCIEVNVAITPAMLAAAAAQNA